MDRIAPKAILAEGLHRAGLFSFIRWGANGRLIVFNYHRIRLDGGHFATPFDESVYGPPAFVFEQQIEWLQRNTRLLSEAELLDSLNPGERHPGSGAHARSGVCSLVTFDDGYLDNYTLALPILKRRGASAIFFIPSNIAASRTLSWWDLIAYVVKKTTEQRISVNGDSLPTANRAAVIAHFQEKMKLEPYARSKDLVARLSEACRVPLPDLALQGAELMTWEHIRELARQGMGVGSHCHTHTVLAALDAEAQRRELATSKEILEGQLGATVRSLAYPVGGYSHFTAETRRLAALCGYRAAFSFGTGTNLWGAIDPYDIRRVSAPVNLSLMIAKVRLPGFFALK